MALLVTPIANHLATNPKPYYVHTEWSDTVEYEKLIDIMATGRTTLTKPDIKGCLQLYAEELGKLLADGRRVKTSLGAFYLCASGTLESPDQAFTPGEGESSHDIRLHFRPDRSFEAELSAKAAVERGKRFDRRQPVIDNAVSARSAAAMRAAGGDLLRVEGQRLKFDRAKAEEGLFFVNGKETRALQYAEVIPSLVIAQVPAGLEPGAYVLAIRSSQGGKELHEGRATKPFVIESL